MTVTTVTTKNGRGDLSFTGCHSRHACHGDRVKAGKHTFRMEITREQYNLNFLNFMRFT